MNHKQTVTALTATPMLSVASPVVAQSVPIIDDNSNHAKGNTDKIKDNTDKIKGYLDEIHQFLGADKCNKTVKGSGLETDVADFKKIESQTKQLTSGQWSNGDEEKFRKAIGTYYGKNTAASSMCNKGGGKSLVKGGTKNDKENMQNACDSVRNLIALNLYEIHQLAEALEERNEVLQKLVKKWDYDISGDLQEKQYQLALMQMLIQDDLSCFQAPLVAHQIKINLYRQIRAEAECNILCGKQVSSPYAQLKKLVQKGGGMLAMIGVILTLEKNNSLVENLVGGAGRGTDNAKKDIRRVLQQNGYGLVENRRTSRQNMDNMENLGFLILIKTYVEILVMKLGDRGLPALSTALIPSLVSMVTVWLMFEDYRIPNGQSREPLNMFLWRGAKTVVIITVTSWITNNLTGLRDWISEHIKNPIASVIVDGEYASSEATVDSSLPLMHLIMGVFGSLQAVTSNNNDGALANFTMASGVAQRTPAVVAGVLLLLNETTLSLAILTVPALILCLLYDPTKQYFQGWLKFFLGSLLTMAVLSVTVTIGLKVVLVYAAKVLGEYGVEAMMVKSASSTESRPGIVQITIMQGGLGLMMGTPMIMASLLVGNLIGFSLGGFSGYNMFSGGNVSRDSNNNPLVNKEQKQGDDRKVEQDR